MREPLISLKCNVVTIIQQLSNSDIYMLSKRSGLDDKRQNTIFRPTLLSLYHGSVRK